MTIYRVFSDKQEGFWPPRVPPNVNKNENIRVLFIDNFNMLSGTWMRSIAGPSALDHSAVSSIAGPCAFNCVLCIRPHYVRSHCVGSIAHNCLKIFTTQVLKRWRPGPARATHDMLLTRHVLDCAPWARA